MKAPWWLLSCLACVGCINTDPAVFVDASIQNEKANIASSSLVTAFGGELNLRLHLSARASGSAEVSVTAFELLGADGTTQLHSPLSYDAGVVFPVTVAQDSTRNITVRFTAEDNQLPTAVADAVCPGGAVRFRAILEDSLRGGSFEASSVEPVAVAGCSP